MLEQQLSEGYVTFSGFVVLHVLVQVELLLITHATGALLSKPPACQSTALRLKCVKGWKS